MLTIRASLKPDGYVQLPTSVQFDNQWIYTFYGIFIGKTVKTIERLSLMHPLAWSDIAIKKSECTCLINSRAVQINSNSILLFGNINMISD